MTKKHSTKKALMASAISLVLCFSMLLGTTYAWFTDSVVSNNNIIKSGNLDIELEYWNGTDWVDVAGKSDILTNTLWEPGVTEIAYLRVKNAGTLAFKYQLGINIISELGGINQAGDPFMLSDYIKFGVVEGVNGQSNAYATREAAVAAVTDAKKISAGYTKASSMESGDELYLALVVYMPTSVDNVANHNGIKIPEINLGINVFATQYTSEEDSFDKYYDAGAPWVGGIDTTWYDAAPTAKEFTINTSEQLAGLAQIVNSGADSFEGDVITLASDLDLGGNAWTPIGTSSAKFNGTFKGEGHTIVDLYVNTSKNAGLFGCTWTSAHIENLTIDGAIVRGNDYVGAVVGGGYISANCIKNCTVIDAEITATPYLLADGVTYDGGAKAGAIVGQAYNGDLTGNKAINCTIEAYRDLGGIAGMLYADGVTNRTIKAYDNEVKNVTLTYFDLNGAKYAGNKVNENMGNIVGRLGRSSAACILPVVENNTEENVTRETLIYYILDGISYAKDVDTDYITFLGLTADFEGTDVVIPEGVDAIGNKTLYQTNITSVTLPSTLSYIGYSVFNGCTSLESVTIPAGVTLAERESGNANTFAGCTSLTTLVIEEGVTSLPKSCFAGCTALKSVTIPASMKSLARRAFYDCLSLESVILLSEDCEIGDSVFGSNQTGKFGEMEIFVVSDAMKAAVEATLDDNNKNFVTVSVMNEIADGEEISGSLTDGADTVYLPEGNYTFPADKIGEGDTIICADGTVFEGTSSLNVDGATVIGGTFSNPSGSAVSQSVNGTFKDCTFTGYNGLRYCYAGDTVVFENCVFDGSVYGVHFDGGANNVIFRNCTMSGFNAMGSAITQLTMEGCTFVANGKSGYNGINLWGSTEMKDCTFVFDGTAGTEWVHARGTNKTYTITNCVVTDGTNVKSIANEFYDYGTGNTVIIDGAQVVSTSDALKAAIEAKASKVLLADGDYSLRFTNNTAFNADGMTIIGNGDNVKLSITSSEVWYGRVQGNNVTFENIHFTSSVGATGKATYNECTFDDWAICASSNNAETYYNDCTINGCLNTSTDFSSGNTFLNGCDVVKAEYSGAATMNFKDCTIGELISWNMDTVLTGCTVTTLVTEHMSSNTITVDGTVVAP